MPYDDGYGETRPEPIAVPPRMWSDAQIDANAYMCVLLQGTSPSVGMYPYSVMTRFSVILGAMAKGLGIENSCKVFQMALMNSMGYDFDKVMAGNGEYDSRVEGV